MVFETLNDALKVNGLLFFGTWILASRLRRLHLIDVLWGTSFGVTAMISLIRAPTLALPQLLLVVLVLVWAIRLSFHLLPRAFHEIEDRRYAAMRENRSELFFLFWSLLAVFCLQLVLSILFSLPFVYAVVRDSKPSSEVLFWIGAFAAVLGLIYETVADLQLGEFLAQNQDANAVLNDGLWRYSRHPNYFGESVFWWGIGGASLGLGAPALTLIAPAGLTFLLLRVSGVSLMESTISGRRANYQRYMQTTNAFLPGPPKKGL